MSFSSLLGKITKDKKLEEKAKQLNVVAKPSTSLSNNKPQPQKLSISHLSALSYPQDNDPAVRRLKEARRLEKEKQNAAKNAKYGTKLGSTKSQTRKQPTSNSKPGRSLSSTPTERRTKSPAKIDLPPAPPPKSRFKFQPMKHNTKPASPAPRSYSSNKDEPPSKVSFKELMQQASKIEKPLTAETNFHFKKQDGNKPQPSKAYQSLQRSRTREEHEKTHRQQPRDRPNGEKRNDSSRGNGSSSSRPSFNSPAPARPAGFAKPNPELLKRLKSKPTNSHHQQQQRSKKTHLYASGRPQKSDTYDIDAQDDDEDEYDEYGYGYDDGYDSQDDFIVDDDEGDYHSGNDRYRDRARDQRRMDDMRSKGYSKDEIWEIFNRGKKRDYNTYDDYDSDDMEATGTEILEDEERTLRQAKLDDMREQKMLEQKALEKRRKLNR